MSEISQDDVAKAVNGPVKSVFPSDYPQALDALNKARPLVLDSQNKLAASLSAFAHELAAIEPAPRSTEKSSGLFGRLTGKR